MVEVLAMCLAAVGCVSVAFTLRDVLARVRERDDAAVAAERELRRELTEAYVAERKELRRRIEDLEAKLLARSAEEYRRWTPPAEKAGREKKEPEPLGPDERIDPVFGRIRVAPLFDAKGGLGRG